MLDNHRENSADRIADHLHHLLELDRLVGDELRMCLDLRDCLIEAGFYRSSVLLELGDKPLHDARQIRILASLAKLFGLHNAHFGEHLVVKVSQRWVFWRLLNKRG